MIMNNEFGRLLKEAVMANF